MKIDAHDPIIHHATLDICWENFITESLHQSRKLHKRSILLVRNFYGFILLGPMFFGICIQSNGF